MSEYTRCFNCGSEGHYARQCAATPPEGAASLQGTPKPPGWVHPSTLRKPPEEIGDYEKGAALARELLGMDPGPYVWTSFRKHMGLKPRTEEQLMRMARDQVAESRQS